MNEQIMNLLEPITYDNIHELKPGEWIWDDKPKTRRQHRRSLSKDTIIEPTGFRQIHIMDEDDVRDFKWCNASPFMLSTIDDDKINYVWANFKEGRFYRFKALHEKEEKENVDNVFDTLTKKQKREVYAIIAEILEEDRDGDIMKCDGVVEHINNMSLDDLSSICKVVLSRIHNKLYEENGFSLEQYCSVASFGPKEEDIKLVVTDSLKPSVDGFVFPQSWYIV